MRDTGAGSLSSFPSPIVLASRQRLEAEGLKANRWANYCIHSEATTSSPIENSPILSLTEKVVVLTGQYFTPPTPNRV